MRADLGSFRAALGQFGNGRFGRFYELAECAAKIDANKAACEQEDQRLAEEARIRKEERAREEAVAADQAREEERQLAIQAEEDERRWQV